MDDPNSRDVITDLLTAYRDQLAFYQRHVLELETDKATGAAALASGQAIIESQDRMLAIQAEMIANAERFRQLNDQFLQIDTGYRKELADKDATIARLESELATARSMLGFDPAKRGSA